MSSWIMLSVQIISAAASLHLLRRHVLPGLLRARQPQVFVDVWLPVALVAPFVLGAFRVDVDVKGEGWVAMGGPIMCAIFASGLALISARGRFDPFGEHTFLYEEDANILWPLRPRIISAALLAGVLLLMLGAAHMLTIWIGQAALALAAILLWINTPDDAPRTAMPLPAETSAGWAMLGVLILSLVHGSAALEVDQGLVAVSTIVMLLYAAIGVAMAAYLVGPGVATRVGYWTAALGVYTSLGILSLGHVLPRAARAVFQNYLEPQPAQIAYGFGAYAFEATLLIVMVPAMVVFARMERPLQVLVGLAMLVAVVALVAWRVLGIA